MKDIKPTITVDITIKAAVETVWKFWTTPADIKQWNNPFEDWHSPRVENNLKEDGRFLFRMETKDGTQGFDYAGKYDKVKMYELIELTTSDGRKAINTFTSNGNETIVTEIFEPESQTPADIQRDFCQRVLNNFKKYAEKEHD